ncbi:MAG: permease prefix domain 1-containing protein [bacterium]
MSAGSDLAPLEEQIGQWRAYLRRRRAITGPDVEELEAHLRDQVGALTQSGLAEDEAFLIAVKRMGGQDALSREFAREHSDRLWKQLVLAPDGDAAAPAVSRTEAFVVLALAVAAAVAIKIPALFGLTLARDAELYGRNASLFVLPFLTGYFVWKRRMDPRLAVWLAVPFLAAAAVVNSFPFTRGPQQPVSHTEVLATIHLPIALWLVVGLAYLRGRWRDGASRMDFARFSGELFIYYVLIALGGVVLTGFTMTMFVAIGLKPDWIAQNWLIPCGAMGAVLVGSWLVEAKQSVVENMAPVLTRLFTPLFTLVLLVFLATMAWTGRPIDIKREVLILFDLLLALVVGLVLFSASARDPEAPPNLFDGLQLVLIVSALVVDALALAAIASRISELGFTPNRVAALGENLILLVNLAWSARLYAAFLRKRQSFRALEAWQTAYLPVYSIWAALVVVLFPPLFGYK